MFVSFEVGTAEEFFHDTGNANVGLVIRNRKDNCFGEFQFFFGISLKWKIILAKAPENENFKIVRNLY